MQYIVSSNIEGLIFDFDGTIVDSMPAHFLSWQEAFAAFGVEFNKQFFFDHAGLSLLNVVETFNRKMDLNLPPASVVAKKNACHMAYLSKTKTIPEVMNIIERYHGRLPMAIATGNARRLTEPLMTILGLHAYFEAVVCGEDVEQGKPHPESFLKAASEICTLPEKCEVFEDGDPGIEAAKSAGMKVTDIRPWLAPAS